LCVMRFGSRKCGISLKALIQVALATLLLTAATALGQTDIPNVYQYAGNGNIGTDGDGCLAANANLNPTFSMSTDPAGNLYIADPAGSRIRRVDRATGIITTYAGTGTPGFSGDNGPATSAQFDGPLGIAFDSAGNLYISDNLNYRIRRVDAATGIVATVAGNGTFGFGGDGGLATDAEFGMVYGVALDPAGNLYIGDDHNYRVRKVDAATGIISTIAGNGTGGFAGDGETAKSAEFLGELYLALDAAGNIYIADTANFRIRKVDAATGIITTVAGNGTQGYSGDGGLGVNAELGEPLALVSDPAGNITFVDTSNNRVRRVDATSGIITTIAGNGMSGFGPMGGPAVDSAIYGPSAVAFDPAGNMYIDVQGVTQILIVGPQPNFSPIATSTSLKASPTTLLAGQPLTLTATVTASACTTPGGTVSFLNGSAPLGIASLDGTGVATLDLTPALGDYSITASYAGASSDAPSTSAPPMLVTVIAPQVQTTTLLTANPTTLSIGQTLTLTAGVSASSGAMPSGFVTFNNGTTDLGSAKLNASGVATLQLMPAAGSYSITAYYTGSSTDAASTSAPPAPVSVTAAATTTSLAASASTVAQGQPIILTATVTATTGPAPSGSVAFYLTGAETSSPTAALNASGVASVTLSALPTGIYHVYAGYAGTSSDAPSSSSPPLTFTVTLPITETALTASPNPAAFGASVTLTATVSNPTSIPTGTVAFYDGTNLLATKNLADGAAAFSTSILAAGSHDMTAAYTPTAVFSASKSTVLVEVVSIASFSISAAPGSRSVYTGEAAAYTIKTAPASGFTLPVALSCAQLPANTTCTFSPASISGGSGSSSLVIQTTSPSPSATNLLSISSGRVAMLAALLLFFMPHRRMCRLRNALVVLLAFFVLCTAITACSGGGSLSGGTPVGSHAILLTGTVTNGVDSLSQNTTVTLNVNSLF
jgi:large repetitive protein